MTGKNIKHYRQMKRMSQEELAQRIGMSKMSVSHYELGKRKPSAEVLSKIACCLDTTPNALLGKYRSDIVFWHGNFCYISTKIALESLYGEIERYMERLFWIISILGDAILPPEPQMQKIPVTSCEQAGLCLRQMLKLPDNGPVGNIFDVAESQGYIICPVAINEPEIFAINGLVNGRPYIAVNVNQSMEQQCMSVVRELVCLTIYLRESDEIEETRNRIVESFLLPNNDLQRELGLRRQDIRADLHRIQGKYKIPLRSIATRAFETGIISRTTYTHTLKWLSAQQTQEAATFRAEQMWNYRLVQLVIRAVSENSISMTEAAQMLGKPFEDVQSLCYERSLSFA